MNQDYFRKLPSVDTLIQDRNIEELISRYGRETVLQSARSTLEKLRGRIRSGELSGAEELELEALIARIGSQLEAKFQPSLRRAVNATGVVLHTGLGRALISETAQKALRDCTAGYCTLATDIESGKRGHRDIHVADLICELTGAEAATVVNNNAAATMLILNSLAAGKEVILSRGQLVEIGGSFRMPDVMTASGAVLREVGTTNKTHLKDYRRPCRLSPLRPGIGASHPGQP
jgi:L-seryl-tRNA(Ser) seleniumtransferase